MKLVKPKKLAEELDVSERHVRQMIADRRWPIYRIGKNRVRMDVDEIKQLCRSAGTDPAESRNVQRGLA